MHAHDTIVRARLAPVILPEAHLRRPRLTQRLQALAPARLVVVRGPAGSGKTVLAVEALAELGGPTAWYSIEPSERDPAVFVAHVLEAIGRIAPGVAQRARRALDGAGPVDAVLTPLLNALWEHEASLRLVLDDVHLVASVPVIRAWLRNLVQQAPANLELWMLTRTPLHLGVEKLLARGQALRLEAAELAFTLNETATLVRETWRWPDNPRLVNELHQATGGWITGLQLLNRQAGTLPGALRSADASSAMYQYLAEQVLDGLPVRLQALLLETSLLVSFDAELAELVTGDAQAMRGLDELRQRGLFLYECDGTFRYHHLFGDFLRHALHQRCGVRSVRERHERLARHFAPLDPARALDHAVQAHAWTDVVALLEKHGDELLQSGYTDRVAGWLARLPGRCSASATLRLLSATVADRRGDGPQALAMYQQLLSVSEREVQAMLLERIMECMVRMGHVAGMAHWADEALALCPPDDVGLQSRMLSWQAGAAFLLGQEADTALQALHRAHDMAYRSGDPVAIWAASAVLGLGGGQFRDLEHSADVLARGARCMADNGYMSKAAHLWINRGLLLTLSGRFEEAAVDLRQATSVPHGDTWLDAALLSAQALLALGRRAMEDAAPFVARLADMAVPPQIRPWALRAQVIYHAGQRQFEKAERLGREMMEALGPVGSRGAYAPACRLDLAAMYARQGRTATALRQAEEALEISQAMGSLVWEAKAKAALADLKGQAAQHPPAELEIFTLGRFAIFRHGRDITTQVCGRAKVGDLLKMFLASPDLAVPVDAAIGCLWPGADPSRGRHDLATQVSRLRRHLGPEAVYYRDQAYHLSTGRVKIDFTELLDWLAQARTALQEGNVVAAERICGWAADLYRGDFLPDDCTPPGLDACRHRLRAQYLETVQVVTNSVSNQPG